MSTARSSLPLRIGCLNASVSAPATLVLGLIIMAACEVLLFIDVHQSHRSRLTTEYQIDLILEQPISGRIAEVARFVAVNMTALAWIGYLVFLEGVLTWQTGASPVRRRPHHFALLCLASIFIWCVFDFINFGRGINAWVYIGLPGRLREKFLGYFFAFATIVPGMLMSGQAMLNAGWFDWAKSREWRMPRWAKAIALVAGIGMFIWPLYYPNPVTNLTLWTSFVFLLDPINLNLGRPSMFRDWQSGWYGRTLAAFAGGLLCGLLWEFWNYWALAKWTYHLPFLGRWENYRYFEMPLPGLIGFIPFGIECWVMWQTIRIAFDGLVEPLGSERELL
jgi:hypothetical protein